MPFQKIKTALKSEKLRKFFIYGIGQAVNLVGPIVVIPYIIGIVGELGLGKIGMGMSLSYILIVVVDYSSYVKGVREISLNRQTPEVLKKSLATIYLGKSILFVFVLALMAISCVLIPYFRDEVPLYMLSMFIVLGQLANPTWFLQGIEDFASISVINVLSKIIYVGAVFGMVAAHSDYIYVNMWLGLGLLIPSAIATARLFVKYKVRWNDFRLHLAWDFIRRDFTFCVSQLLFAFRQYSPILVVGALSGSVVAGQFKIIEQIVMLFRTYFQTVFKFSLGIVTYEINKQFSQGLQTWKRLNGYNIVLVTAALFATCYFQDEVLAFFKVSPLFLPTYERLLPIALVIPFFIGITLAQEQLMFSFDKNRDYIRITVLITILSTSLLCLGVWISGLLGAFLALLCSEFILSLIYCVYLNPCLRQKQAQEKQQLA